MSISHTKNIELAATDAVDAHNKNAHTHLHHTIFLQGQKIQLHTRNLTSQLPHHTCSTQKHNVTDKSKENMYE